MVPISSSTPSTPTPSFPPSDRKECSMHIPFPQELISSVPRWLAQYRLSQGMSMEIPTRKIVTTYASLLGWGAYLQGELVWGL